MKTNDLNLTEQEYELLARIHATKGSMDEKAQQLKDDGVFDSYREIHKGYASLAIAGDIESLKRSIFIQWYRVSEPSCFTGIQELDQDIEEAVLLIVENLIFNGHADEELKWMIAWYYQISGYYFDLVWTNSSVSQILTQFNQNRNYLVDRFPLGESLKNRGQMGKYWMSIISKMQTLDSKQT